MIDTFLSIIAPYLCYGCGKMGALLCDNCKYDITTEKISQCIVCRRPTNRTGVCQQCHVPYDRAWCVGERFGTLQRLIGGYKFQNVYAAHKPLASLLLNTLDELPPETVIVPMPTAPAHIRERGYDHMLLIARVIARTRGVKLKRVLYRTTNTKQRGASRSERITQAKAAFKIRGKIDKELPYLLIDDIVTTGATLQYAAQALQSAGAKHIWVAVIARQPLD